MGKRIPWAAAVSFPWQSRWAPRPAVTPLWDPPGEEATSRSTAIPFRAFGGFDGPTGGSIEFGSLQNRYIAVGTVIGLRSGRQGHRHSGDALSRRQLHGPDSYRRARAHPAGAQPGVPTRRLLLGAGGRPGGVRLPWRGLQAEPLLRRVGGTAADLPGADQRQLVWLLPEHDERGSLRRAVLLADGPPHRRGGRGGRMPGRRQEQRRRQAVLLAADRLLLESSFIERGCVFAGDLDHRLGRTVLLEPGDECAGTGPRRVDPPVFAARDERPGVGRNAGRRPVLVVGGDFDPVARLRVLEDHRDDRLLRVVEDPEADERDLRRREASQVLEIAGEQRRGQAVHRPRVAPMRRQQRLERDLGRRLVDCSLARLAAVRLDP